MSERAQRGVTVRPGDRPGDLGWVVQSHGEVYAEEFGWGADFEALVARIVGAAAPAAKLFIAEVDGVRAGCVMLVPGDDEGTAMLRVLLVARHARGHGVAGALVDELLRSAQSVAYRRVTLWTFRHLSAARRVYERAGFTLEHEAPVRRFGQDLVEQVWALALVRTGAVMSQGMGDSSVSALR